MAVQVIEQIGEKQFFVYLKDEHHKIQSCILNMLNLVLLYDNHSRVAKVIVEDQVFLRLCVDLVEHSSVDIRGKSLMTLYLLSKLSPPLLLKCCEMRLCQQLEKIYIKDKDVYVRKCLNVIISAIAEVVPPVVHQIVNDFEGKMRHSMNKQKSYSELSVVLQVMTTPCLSCHVLSEDLIRSLAKSFSIEDVLTSPFEELAKTLLLIIEAISQQQDSVIEQHTKSIVDALLPALLHMMQSDVGDERFICLKLVTDLLLRLLTNAQIYSANLPIDSPTSLADSLLASRTNMINQFILKYLLSHYKSILDDQDPVPLHGLKLLNNIAERNPNFVLHISKYNIVPKLFDFFELEHRNNNVHNVKLILKVISSEMLDLQQLYPLGLITKVNSVLSYAFDNGVDAFFEPCLSIVGNILYRSSKYFQKSKQQQNDANIKVAQFLYSNNEALLENTRVYLHLCSHQDANTTEASAHVVLLLCQQYPKIHEHIVHSGLQQLRRAMASYQQTFSRHVNNDASPALFVLKTLLFVVQASGKNNLAAKVQKELLQDVLWRSVFAFWMENDQGKCGDVARQLLQ